MSVFHCGMHPLCPPNLCSHRNFFLGGDAKKIPALLVGVCAPQLQNRVGAYGPIFSSVRYRSNSRISIRRVFIFTVSFAVNRHAHLNLGVHEASCTV